MSAVHWSIHTKREVLKWSRTIHIYLSLSAFAMFLFFAVTGVMLTHDSFGLDRVTASSKQGKLSPEAAKSSDEAVVVAAARAAFGIRIPATQVSGDDDQIQISFAGPANRAEVTIRRSDGSAEANFESRGFVGMMADLHKGADTGWAWRGVLDVVSVWIAISSITGFIMLLALPKRRALGLLIVVAGTIVTAAAYALYVPR